MARPKPAPVRTKPKPSRYTPPKPKSSRSSPKWLPVLMFGLFAVGALVVVLNYMNLLPGDASTAPLLIGLGLITAGFLVATQYR